MSGFSFPPPPPPPPKANTSYQQGTPQRGGRGNARVRGDRGNFQQRGRGQSNGRARGGHSQYSHEQAGLIFHPNPVGGPASPIDPSQATTHGHNGTSSTPQRSSFSNGHEHPGSPPRTAAGHKRKLDALRGPPQKKPERRPAPATAPAVPTFGAQVFAVPPSTLKNKASPSLAGQPRQKPAPRSLGLVPATDNPHYPSSESDNDDAEIDEEAAYAELGDKLTFEHNGLVMSLNSQADLVAWKKDRQKNWPTKARMVTKDEERRKVGAERRRLLAGVGALYATASPFVKPGSNIWTSTSANTRSEDEERSTKNTSIPTSEFAQPETGLEKARRDLEEKTNRLEELRRKVTESETRNRRARERAEKGFRHHGAVLTAQQPQDRDLPMGDPVSKAEGEVDEVETELTGKDEADANSPADSPTRSDFKSDSDTSSESDDSDSSSSSGPPEETSSKLPITHTLTTNTGPPDNRPPCRYLLTKGHCRNGDACSYSHNIPTYYDSPDFTHRRSQRPEAEQTPGHVRQHDRSPRLDRGVLVGGESGKRKTIFQRLMEQEEEGDERLALKVVKFLGQGGFFRGGS